MQIPAGSGHPSPEMEAALTVKYGLEQPLHSKNPEEFNRVFLEFMGEMLDKGQKV